MLDDGAAPWEGCRAVVPGRRKLRLAARSLSRPAHSGWEDAAVPPERLGAWLRDFEELLRDHDLDGVPYGHFGDGCVHVRIDFPLTEADGGSVHQAFVE